MKLSVAWFSVKDFEQAKKFYGNILGMKKSFEMDGWAEFTGGEGEAANTTKSPTATLVILKASGEDARTQGSQPSMSPRSCQARSRSPHHSTQTPTST